MTDIAAVPNESHEEDPTMPTLSIVADEAVQRQDVRALGEFLDQALERHVPGVVVRVSGTPRQILDGETDIKLVNRWERQLRKLERFQGPVVLGASGRCGGAAAELLMCGDVRLVTETFAMVLPHTEIGMWPSMLTYRLAQQLGPARARQLLLRERELDAEHCLQLGLVDQSVADGELDAALAVSAADLSEVDSIEFALRRQLVLDAITTPFEEALGRHLAACERAVRLLGDQP